MKVRSSWTTYAEEQDRLPNRPPLRLGLRVRPHRRTRPSSEWSSVWRRSCGCFRWGSSETVAGEASLSLEQFGPVDLGLAVLFKFKNQSHREHTAI